MASEAGKANDGIEERETFLQHSTPKKSKFIECTTFIYNRQRKTCLGRTAKSWLEIAIFYIIFYFCLAAFFAACLAVFVATLDDKVPRYYGKGTIIGINPGMGYQPWLERDPDSTLIRFNIQDSETYKPYVDSLKEYLERYKNTNGTRSCAGKQSNSQEVNVSCRFDLEKFEKEGCGEANDFGFKDGKPCVVLTLNRLIGWRPVDYPADSEPEAIKNRYKAGDVGIYCAGKYEPDGEHIGVLKYIPKYGMSGKYFPFKVTENYHQPIAMVKFDNPPHDRVILVECRAYAYNIVHDPEDRLGLVHFELLVEDRKPESDESSR